MAEYFGWLPLFENKLFIVDPFGGYSLAPRRKLDVFGLLLSLAVYITEISIERLVHHILGPSLSLLTLDINFGHIG